MDLASTEERVTSVIRTALHIHDITTPLSMGATPGWDSLGHMSVILALEREFGVRVPLVRIPELVDVASISRALTSEMK